MKANTYELKEVLSSGKRFNIPIYQRNYEWTKDEQWALLHEDLVEAARRLQQARAAAVAKGDNQLEAESTVAPHFLGAVVCEQLLSPTGGVDQRVVIDGQQRLTTLQLLARSVLDVVLESGQPRVAALRKLISNPEEDLRDPRDAFKLWPRRKDRDIWPDAMADIAPTLDGHPYLEARRYFADQTREAIRADLPRSVTLDEVVDALLGLFKLVVIDLEKNDDAQVIFEVLNGRQSPLSASDLVKNLLFLRADLKGENELDALYDAHWTHFDDEWWTKTIGAGHAARGRRDVLMSNWLTAVTGSETNVGHLYQGVRNYLGDRRITTTEVLKQLHMYARAYQELYARTPIESQRLSRSYARIETSGVTAAAPLLLWLRTLPVAVLSMDAHEEVVTAIESWVIRRILTSANTRGYGAFFVDVLKAGRKALESGDDIVSAIFRALDADSAGRAWPTDSEVVEAFRDKRFYNSLRQDRIRLILGAVDWQLREENSGAEPAEFDYGKLEIEHVMPQKWRSHWPLEVEDDAQRELAAQQRDSVVHRMGNLTLVTARFNKDVSNLSWDVKRPELAKQSILLLNKTVSGADAWDETVIEKRARQLAAVACRVWPRPLQTEKSVVPKVEPGSAAAFDAQEEPQPDTAPSSEQRFFNSSRNAERMPDLGDFKQGEKVITHDGRTWVVQGPAQGGTTLKLTRKLENGESQSIFRFARNINRV